MNDNFNSIRLGNLAFIKDEYAEAIKCYTAASNSNVKPIKSDACLNRALAHEKLGLTQHARNDFSEAVNSSYKNILIDLVKKKVLPSNEDIKDANDQINDDYDNNSNYGNLFQQFHSNNSYIHSHYNYNNHKKIKNTSKVQYNPEEPLDCCFSNSGFFLECSKIQDIKDQNSFQYTSSYKRRTELNKINEYISAMQDAQNGIALGPQSPNYWLIRAKASFTLRQLETALECVHFFEQRKHQNLSKNDPSNSNTLATINALKKLYSENSNEDKQIRNKFTQQSTNNYQWEINNSRLFRISLNITRGRISEVLYDDPTHPLVIFATRELPTQLTSIILNRSPFVYFILEAIRKTLHFPGRKLYKVLKPDFGIDSIVQQGWYKSIKGVPRLILQLFPQITNGSITTSDIGDDSDNDEDIDEFGDDDKISLESTKTEKEGPIPPNFAPKLMEQALLIGKQICPERSSFRDAALSGLAALEISELIRSWSDHERRNLKGENDKKSDESPIFPSFDLVLSITLTWLRFSYPNFPIFPSRGVCNSTENIELVCSGVPHNQVQFDTYASLYAHKVIERLISHTSVADSISLFGGIGVDMKKPETILAFTKTPVNVKLEGLNGRIYLKQQKFGTYDFGIAISDDDVERDKMYDSLSQLFETIVKLHSENLNKEKTSDLSELIKVTTINSEKPLKMIFKFLFDWIITKPIMTFSTAAGQIIFAALIHAFFGLAVYEGMPCDTEIDLETYLTNDASEFTNNLMRKITTRFVGNEFESVIDTLPDMQYRVAMLLDVPDEDNFNNNINDDDNNNENNDNNNEKNNNDNESVTDNENEEVEPEKK